MAATAVKPRFGLTYPTVTGETKTEAWRRAHADFPELGVWSDYYDGTKLPTWTEAWFTEAGPDVVFLVSIKHTSVSAIGACVATMPEHLRGRVFLFLHHEPDQWRSPTDPRNDPAPSVWIQRQIDFADLREAAPWRLWVQHWVCFTEDRYRTDTAVWEANWGGTIAAEPRIDGVAFDCFNIGRSVYRTGAEMFAEPLEFARREGRKLIIREWGQVVPVDTALDNEDVAEAVREHWAYAKDQNAIDAVFRALVWYNNHNNVYADPSGQRPGRPLTRAALAEIMADAAQVDEPDPCCAQVAELEARVVELSQELDAASAELEMVPARLQAARDEGVAAGRAQAFTEVVAWAQAQS
jgi:hypothetical protein